MNISNILKFPSLAQRITSISTPEVPSLPTKPDHRSSHHSAATTVQKPVEDNNVLQNQKRVWLYSKPPERPDISLAGEWNVVQGRQHERLPLQKKNRNGIGALVWLCLVSYFTGPSEELQGTSLQG